MLGCDRKAVAHNKGWRYIASRLPGRSDDAVRNRWKRLRDPSEVPVSPPLTDSSEGGGGLVCKPPPVVKPKKERVTWSPAEDQVS